MNVEEIRALTGVMGFIALELFEDDATSSSSSSSDDDDDDMLLAVYIGTLRNSVLKVKGFAELCLQMNDVTFQRHFRLSRTTFDTLLAEVSIRREEKRRGILPRRRPVETFRSLLLTVWILANKDSFREISNLFGLAKGTCHKIFMEIVTIICEMSDVHLKWPNVQQLNVIKEEFNLIGGINSFPNVIGAIDGKHFAIPAPSVDARSYINRKSYYSINVQAICDSHGIFLDVFAGWPGSSHDSRVWRNSPIAQYLDENNVIPLDCHLIGDSAYPLLSHLMTPFRDNHHLTAAQRNYNRMLCSKRVVIERAFGLLCARMRRLLYLHMSNLEEISTVIIAGFVIHNICLKLNDIWVNDQDFDLLEGNDMNLAFDDQAYDNDAIAKRNEIVRTLAR